MKALLTLQTLGYEVRLKGEDIEFLWDRKGEPDLEQVQPLLKDVKVHKREAVEFLKSCRVASMPLEEFSRGFKAIRVWSEVLGCEAWFVSNDKTVQEFELKGLIFTGEELAHLMRLQPSPGDLRIITEAKEAVRGRLVDSKGAKSVQ